MISCGCLWIAYYLRKRPSKLTQLLFVVNTIIGFQIQLFTLEMFFIAGVLGSISMGAHGAVVGVIIGNLILLAWFWYNLVRSVDVTADGSLRFWIGNIEVDCPYDKIVSIRRVSTKMPCSLMVTAQPYRGFLATPVDGVAIVTTLPSTPFWLWPRSAGKPDRSCCCLSCPRLTVVFSPSGGSTAFIREVEGEMRNFANASNIEPTSTNGAKQRTSTNNPDYLDV